MKSEVDTAKSILERELKEAPYVKDNLLGNAATCRKIEEYVIASVVEKKDRSECLNWFKDLLERYEVEDKNQYTYEDVVDFAYSTLTRHIEKRINNYCN